MIEEWEGKRARRDTLERIPQPHSELRKSQLGNIGDVVNYNSERKEQQTVWLCLLQAIGSSIRSVRYYGVWVLAKQFGGDIINRYLLDRGCKDTWIPNYLDGCCRKAINIYGQTFFGALWSLDKLKTVLKMKPMERKLNGWCANRLEADGSQSKTYSRTGCITVVDRTDWDQEGEELFPYCMLCSWNKCYDCYGHSMLLGHHSHQCNCFAKIVYRWENVYFIFDGQFFDLPWYRVGSNIDGLNVKGQLRDFLYKEVDHYPVYGDDQEYCNL